MVVKLNRIDEEMKFSFEFTSPVSIELEETKVGVAVISGTLLAEGMSRNGNLYSFEEMQKIADSAKGAPIYFGTATKINPNTGLRTKNMHANEQPNFVGRIMETFLDPIARKIKFIAHIVENASFPNLIEEVKKGWGVSIGGKGIGRYLIDAAGNVITKILGMTVNHVQLLAPDTPRGQEAAQVETSEPKTIEESFSWVEDEKPNNPITEITLGRGISEFSYK